MDCKISLLLQAWRQALQEDPEGALARVLAMERRLAELEARQSDTERLAEDGLLLALAHKCDLCGAEFRVGQEVFLITRARLEAHDGLLWANPLMQQLMCATVCAGKKVVYL